MITFGPVPSRRLGRSLGINNIPPKICSYSCVYCQLGKTLDLRADREVFYGKEAVLAAVKDRVEKAGAAGESIDYLTFVPDGEPTLDMDLGAEIEALKTLGLPVAVITNASLIRRREVRDQLLTADWVSLKVDAVTQPLWRRINRPHGTLSLHAILEGALLFAEVYKGKLVTETMLVAGVNDTPEELTAISEFLSRLSPSMAYVSIPTRPPAEKWVRVPDERAVSRAHHRFSRKVPCVELLVGYEGNAFAFTGDVREDLLSITAVHPMRKEAVDAFLKRSGADWDVVRRMVGEGELVETRHGDHTFYLRKLKNASGGP